MSTQWMLKTKGDPLGALTNLMGNIWKESGLKAMLAPPSAPGEVRILDDPAGLEQVNPFQPLMLTNSAKIIPQLLKERKDTRIGALLRPCEMRALNEMARISAFETEHLLTICVDCLGTFPEDEFGWRATRKGSDAGLTKEALQFAPQGGIAAYRYRAACQMCRAPGAKDADVNIGVLGLPVRQVMLVDAENNTFDWVRLTDGQADHALTTKRNLMIAKLSERHGRTRERVISGLNEVLPADVDALLGQFEACGACQTCMDNCPICAVTYPQRDQHGHLKRQDVINWLASCAGCGMCEQSCPKHLPLSIIFAHVKQLIEKTPTPQ